MRAHVAPPLLSLSLSLHYACTCAAAFLARACIMHGDPAEKYIFAVRRAEMYSPNYLRIGVPNLPPLPLLSPTTAHSKASPCSKERPFRPFLLSLPSPPFPTVDSTFAWNAFIWNRPFFQRLLERAVYPLPPRMYCARFPSIRARVHTRERERECARAR